MYQKSEKFGGYYWHKHREKQLAVESSKSYETEREEKTSTDDSSADILRLDGPSSAVAVTDETSWQKVGRFIHSFIHSLISNGQTRTNMSAAEVE